MFLTREIAQLLFQNTLTDESNNQLLNLMIDYRDEEFITVKLFTKEGETNYKGYTPIRIKRNEEEWSVEDGEIKNKKVHAFPLIKETQKNTVFSHYTLNIKEKEIKKIKLSPLPINQNISPEFKTNHILCPLGGEVLIEKKEISNVIKMDLDTILEKISLKGTGSLSNEEFKFLKNQK